MFLPRQESCRQGKLVRCYTRISIYQIFIKKTLLIKIIYRKPKIIFLLINQFLKKCRKNSSNLFYFTGFQPVLNGGIFIKSFIYLVNLVVTPKIAV